MAASTSSSALTVFVIGGGIGGLVAAIFLAQAGHEVVVIEHKSRYSDDNNDIGQGLNLTMNATKLLFALGIEHDFLHIADVGRTCQIKSFRDGSSIRTAETLHGHWMVHRADFLRLLVKHATKADVKIHIKQSFLGMIEHESGVGVMLQDGRCLQADVVIGADGINSRTRECIDDLREYKPILTKHCTFLMDVPKEAMARHVSSCTLYDDGKDPFQFWLGPERSIIGWTMTRRNKYHLQFNDHAYGEGMAYDEESTKCNDLISTVGDMDAFRRRWADFEPAIKQLLGETSASIRWKIAELPDLPTWSSPGGRIILLGDAAHALPPYAGQGAAMAIEDAAVLATLLSSYADFPSFGDVAKTFERSRRPRIQGFREIIHSNVKQFGESDPDAQQRFGGEAGWTTEKRYKWIDNYNAVEEAKQCLKSLQK